MIDTEWAFRRYEAVRPRLVEARFGFASEHAPNLAAVADRFDAFVLDAFGVLNVGGSAIPGAKERLAWLRAAGKRLVVLTNGATQSRAAALAKYRQLGFDFTAHEVVASRDLAAAALVEAPFAAAGWGRWAAASGPAPDFGDLGVAPVDDLLVDDHLHDTAAGFVLFSSAGWTDARQARLAAALGERLRPVLVANPDIVAPREAGFTLEPGHFAHELEDRLGVRPRYYGKPFTNAFRAALARLGEDVDPRRIAMVGDTLHTDVLGGRAAGLSTVLVTDHGLFAGHDVGDYIARSGIVPDVIVPTI